MAAFSTIMAFDMVKFGSDYTRDFICKSVEVGNTENFECFPLYLNALMFYEDDDTQGWAKAIQVGAIFAIIAAATGCFAFALLLTSTCFSLAPRRILAICILQAIACFFSIFSLIAGAVDGCKYADLDSYDCENRRGRLEEGALFMLAAFFLYIASMVMTFPYYQQARREAQPIAASKDEIRNLATTTPQQPPRIEDIEIALHGDDSEQGGELDV